MSLTTYDHLQQPNILMLHNPHNPCLLSLMLLSKIQPAINNKDELSYKDFAYQTADIFGRHEAQKLLRIRLHACAISLMESHFTSPSIYRHLVLYMSWCSPFHNRCRLLVECITKGS